MFRLTNVFIPPPNEVGGGILDSPCPSVRPSVRPSVCRRHGFRSISQVWFGISIWNFIWMLMVVIGRSLLIFSDVTFKMAAWRPFWIFWFPDSLVWLWISTSNFSGTILMYMGRSLLIFSGAIFKMAAWRPYWLFWFLDSVGGMVSRAESSLFWNFDLKFHIHVHGGHRQKPIDFQWCHFQNGRRAGILDVLVSRLFNFSLAMNINSKLQWHNTYVYG